ncbi:MAG: MBL fold metallo-hydrolase [Steroidobacteraceae bacterium]
MLIAIGAVMAVAHPGVAQAQTPPDYSKVEIQTTDLGHRTYMLVGQGGNMTAAVGDDGIILVDTEFAPLHDKIEAALATLSPQPVKYVVNTHYHGDHTGGNEAFAKEGAIVVGDPNVARRLTEGVTNALTGATTPPAPAAVPAQIYKGKTTLKIKGRSAQVIHEPNAHTDGDSAVYFADANVLAAGDIVSVGSRFPNIDVAAGGNIKGIIAAVDRYLKMTNDTTRIVPGHGPLIGKAELAAYRELLVTARDRIATLIKQGKSEDEVVAAKPLDDLGQKIGVSEPATTNFERLIYRSLKS